MFHEDKKERPTGSLRHPVLGKGEKASRFDLGGQRNRPFIEGDAMRQETAVDGEKARYTAYLVVSHLLGADASVTLARGIPGKITDQSKFIERESEKEPHHWGRKSQSLIWDARTRTYEPLAPDFSRARPDRGVITEWGRMRWLDRQLCGGRAIIG
jgi:hypothetical protein